ncbi:uncharacterized protein F4822DRAFT_429411 [Hypoxylon trugodes]|uniref:uncharacterized protein n=1 Tax=Hypoxylon trugodes TaxID=326681 RepID=UPI00218DDBE6|nr:uncharacterized protein F4822DRAFT_429411 [Hypoxylon trugodes]KAI1388795.1 hypothetical protein F4822DRAFT_429411 [Hypoxylon trugodes]
MPVLTKKRKAELEAAGEGSQAQAQLQGSLETDKTRKLAAKEHPSKRQKRADPYKIIDPFRPFSPPPKTVMRRKGRAHQPNVPKKTIVKPPNPPPFVFCTVPTINSVGKLSSKGGSSKDVGTIMAAKSLIDHADCAAEVLRDPVFEEPIDEPQEEEEDGFEEIPLPRKWVEWAVENGVHEVPGRGDIRDPGTYVADDTYNYDLLYETIHRGFFRTGRLEVDIFPEHWPMVRGHRDGILADLDLRPLSPPVEQKVKGKGKEPVRSRLSPESTPAPTGDHSPSVSPSAPGPNRVNQELSTIKEESESPVPISASIPRRRDPTAVPVEHSSPVTNTMGTFGLPDDFYDTTDGDSTILVED